MRSTGIAFGKPIGENQAVAFKIADMEMRAHTARLAYYDAAERMLRGEPFKRQAAIAKLYSSEIAVTNAREATQVHGGYGFMNETRSPGCGATRRSSRSVRAPPRCSAC